MIHYLVTERHSYTVARFLQAWGAPLASKVSIVSYEQTRRYLKGGRLRRRSVRGVVDRLARVFYAGRKPPRPAHEREAPPTGAWIFSDVDRLDARQREAAAAFREVLLQTGAARSVHNDPLATMGRYELLRTLRERGLNDFDVFRLTEARRPSRYPVFLRTENAHDGAETPLLAGPAELDAALEALDRQGKSRHDRLIVEFCAQPDARGLYRKYSTWKLGGELLPGHLFFGSNWMLKTPEVVDEAALREERAYLDENPHADVLDEVFRLARIDYGRVDYGLVDGRVQVYEVNTNPGIPSSPAPGPGALRAEIDALFNERILARFEALDREAGASG